jgi:hypothetical protein
MVNLCVFLAAAAAAAGLPVCRRLLLCEGAPVVLELQAHQEALNRQLL